MPTLSAKRRSWNNVRLRRAAKAAPSGYAGSSYGGGPLFVDAYKTRRSPSSWEILEYYKGLIYIFSNYNAFGTARFHLRMYVITKSGQSKPKSYLGTKAVSRATKLRLKSLGYCAKSVAGAETIEEVTDHPILRSLEMVNPFMDHCQMVMNIAYSMDVIGEAYIDPVLEMLGSAKTPMELWPLPAQLVIPIPSGTSLIPSGYQYGARRYEIDELIRFRWLSLRNAYMQGYSPARAAIQYARLEDEWVSVQDSLLSNGPRPNILLTPKDPAGVIGKEERIRLRNEFNQQARAGRQGGLVITDGALETQTLSYQLADLGQIKISEYDLERVANCFGVPAPMYTKETNLANMQAAEARHAKDAIEPRHRAIASTLTRYFRGLDPTGKRGWDRILFAFDPCVAEDKLAESVLHKTYHNMGAVTKNEIRLDIGREEIEDGDEILIDGKLVRLRDTVAGVQEVPEDRDALLAEETGQELDNEVEDENGDIDDGESDEGGAASKGLTDAAQTKAVRRPPKPDDLLKTALGNLGLVHDYADGSISPKERLAALHELRLVARAWLRAEAESTLSTLGGEAKTKGLTDKAKKVVAKFFQRAGKFLKNAFVAAALAVFGPGTPSQAEIDSIDRSHAIQMEFMDNFQREVGSGEQPLDGTFPSRAEMYGGTAWNAGMNAGRDVATASNLFVEEMREHLGDETPTDPCHVCRDQRDLGWQPIGTLLPIGSSPCMSSCHCAYVFRTEDGQEWDVGGGPLDEIAFGTR